MRVGWGVALAALGVASVTAAADVQLVRRADGTAVIFNQIGSGWLVDGRAPSDAYLVERRAAPSPWDEAIRTTALRNGVDPQIVKSVMLVESNFNPRAVSRKGARGLMQLMPETARRFGVADRFDPLENLRGGVEYLAGLLRLYGGDVALALAAYNAGESAVARHAGVPPYAETREYVRRALVAWRGTPVPALGGGFRGTSVASAPAPAARPAGTAPVRVASLNGTPVLTNTDNTDRVGPLLGRVR
jgi:soluble lytic murein transglycosylase-like protein